MAKITIPNVLGMFLSVIGINSRFNQVQDELNNKVLYRDNPGTEPNQMENDLDMNGNDIINLDDIRTSDGRTFVRGITGSPNIIVTDDGDGNYNINGVSLGGGDVFRAFDNDFLIPQTMPDANIAGYEIGSTLSTFDSDITTVNDLVTVAQATATDAAAAAATADSKAEAAKETAEDAEDKANQNAVTVATKISQSDADARYVRSNTSRRIPVTMGADDFTGSGVSFGSSKAWAILQDNTMMFGGFVLFDSDLQLPGNTTRTVTISTKGLFGGGAYNVSPVFNPVGLKKNQSGTGTIPPVIQAEISSTTSQSVEVTVINGSSVDWEMKGFTWHCFGLSS